MSDDDQILDYDFANEASGDGLSLGPVANLHHLHWKLGLERLDFIENLRQDERFTKGTEVAHSALILTLIGVATLQVLGRHWDWHVDQNKNRSDSVARKVPSFKELIDNFTDLDSESEEVRDFLKAFDAVRHFGHIKHEVVRSLTEDKVRKLVNTAKQICSSSLTKRGRRSDWLDENFASNNTDDYSG